MRWSWSWSCPCRSNGMDKDCMRRLNRIATWQRWQGASCSGHVTDGQGCTTSHYNDIDTDIDMDRNNVNGRQTRPPRSHSILTLPLVLVSMNVVVQYSYTYGERWRSQHLHLEQSLWNVMLWHDCQWRIILNCNCTVDGMRHVSCRLLRKLQLQSSWYDLSYCHMIRYPHPKAFGWNLQTTIVLASTSYWIISHWHPIQSYHIQSNRFLLHTFYIPQYNLTLSFPTNTLSITTTTIHNQQDKN